MGVEIGYWLRNGLRIDFEVDVEIVPIRDVVVVLDHDLCLFLERHREIAIQCNTAAVAMAFLWLAGNRDRERRKVTGNRVADTKEITQRRENAWLFLVVPEDFQEDLAIIKWVRFFPVYPKRVVDFKDGRNITTEDGINQRPDNQSAAELGHPKMGDTARPDQLR